VINAVKTPLDPEQASDFKPRTGHTEHSFSDSPHRKTFARRSPFESYSAEAGCAPGLASKACFLKKWTAGFHGFLSLGRYPCPSAQALDLQAFSEQWRDQNIPHRPACPAGSAGYISLGVMRVLAISGSLRTASVNSALLRATARLAPSEMEVLVYAKIHALPLFNPDLEAEVPFEVTALREEVAAADALIFASPEYAHGVTGVIKNTLDWLVSFEPFAYKPVAIFSASPRSKYADPALRETLQTMSASIVNEACFSFQLVGAKMSETDMVLSPGISAAIEVALGALKTFQSVARPKNSSFPLE